MKQRAGKWDEVVLDGEKKEGGIDIGNRCMVDNTRCKGFQRDRHCQTDRDILGQVNS